MEEREIDRSFFNEPYSWPGRPATFFPKPQYWRSYPSALDGWTVIEFKEPINLLNGWDDELMMWVEENVTGPWYQHISKNYADGTFYHTLEFMDEADAMLAKLKWS